MKSILSAAALLAVIASPALAEEAVTAQPKAEPAVMQEIVPAATQPSMSEAQPTTEAAPQSKAMSGMGGHGCGSKQTVYLTN
jgi:opacity protein-like surface antigen